MTKQEKKLSATAMMRQAIPPILKEKFKDGATFDELWNELLKDKELGKLMINCDKKPRYGLLQGLTNRIKDNKEENISLIKKSDGKNYYIYYDNTIQKITKLTENYLSSITTITLDEETKLTKETEKLLKEHQSLIKKLNNLNQNLIAIK
ncbi:MULTISPECIES: hypothetical protein [Vagococcus]|uniref:Uncharacterized protein n=1 Tax=Vagococcus fluvialis bH819 TaxID=1255619 RepID=A0A1X6WP72_9ENTE|nr:MULTISPECIES: hypothetical protein [Vagococcus]SLM85466.1 hypothetical protein FM121_05160 [Vagococcus fluvialis bH819]HCM89241.1 hypothetical protein [Vagococcus sp.]